MSKAIVLNTKFENSGEVVLPANYEEIKNTIYTYIKIVFIIFKIK